MILSLPKKLNNKLVWEIRLSNRDKSLFTWIADYRGAWTFAIYPLHIYLAKRA